MQGQVQRGTARQGLRWQHGGLSGLPCRLHWWTRLGGAWSGKASCGMARRGGTRQGSQTVARRASAFPATLKKVDADRLGRFGLGRVWRGLVEAWQGPPDQGLQTAALGASAPTAALFGGQTRLGSAPLGVVRQGWSRHGRARRGMGCRRQHGASSEVPCCSHQRAVEAGFGLARWGRARQGRARPGEARQGLTISARRAQILPAGFTQHT